MRAVTAGGDAVGIATTIDPEAPKATTTVERKIRQDGGLFAGAQFEREVTSERIRDKIAASKRKGLWVGGPLPLGYEMRDGNAAYSQY